MLGSTVKDGKWTYPRTPDFEGGDVPFFSPDGQRLYFISRKPIQEGERGGKENIWFVERIKSGWSDPKPVDPVVNSAPMHWQFSIDKKGTFYIGSGDGRILVSPKKNGRYQNPVDFRELYKNESVHGGSPYISPDGDYLIFNKNDDLFITFRKPDGFWTTAQDMGKRINTSAYELCPIVSPDGKYLIYITTRNNEWGPHWVVIDDLINELRKRSLDE
jgi:Tol biopolymer transport system component